MKRDTRSIWTSSTDKVVALTAAAGKRPALIRDRPGWTTMTLPFICLVTALCVTLILGWSQAEKSRPAGDTRMELLGSCTGSAYMGWC